MEPKTETNKYFFLRWFRPRAEDEIYYACDTSPSYRDKREWTDTTARSAAHHFYKRSDARRTVRSTAFDRLRKRGFYWEVIEIRETVVRTYDVNIVVSDAPPLVTIARSAE